MIEPGYYWVKFDGEWQPAEYYVHKTGTIHWSIIGDECSFPEVEEIGERIIRNQIAHIVLIFLLNQNHPNE